MNKYRREEIKDVISFIDDAYNFLDNVKDGEEEAYENLPEGLQCSSRGEELQENSCELDEILGLLQESRDRLEKFLD